LVTKAVDNLIAIAPNVIVLARSDALIKASNSKAV